MRSPVHRRCYHINGNQTSTSWERGHFHPPLYPTFSRPPWPIKTVITHATGYFRYRDTPLSAPRGRGGRGGYWRNVTNISTLLYTKYSGYMRCSTASMDSTVYVSLANTHTRKLALQSAVMLHHAPRTSRKNEKKKYLVHVFPGRGYTGAVYSLLAALLLT